MTTGDPTEPRDDSDRLPAHPEFTEYGLRWLTKLSGEANSFDASEGAFFIDGFSKLVLQRADETYRFMLAMGENPQTEHERCTLRNAVMTLAFSECYQRLFGLWPAAVPFP